MKTLTAAILAALLASAGACATTGGGIERSKGERLLSTYEPYLGEPVDSVTAFRQDSWQPISRTQLVIWTTVNDAFLLTIESNCPNLLFAHSVSVTSSTSSITTMDAVIVQGDRCQIVQIQPIDVRRMRADRHPGAGEEAATPEESPKGDGHL